MGTIYHTKKSNKLIDINKLNHLYYKNSLVFCNRSENPSWTGWFFLNENDLNECVKKHFVKTYNYHITKIAKSKFHDELYFLGVYCNNFDECKENLTKMDFFAKSKNAIPYYTGIHPAY